ncbi:MAG: DinB family protein [Balneolaceae bacterium]|nr:DinB family protein [Balneolaceae bacterium]MBO6546636.1 DinB family protein [Balneolaceae bacterium]MBO6648994.1 DinB family protein [Balneolaceae bacterium]
MKKINLLLVLILSSNFVNAQTGTLTNYERQFLLDNWEVTKTELLSEVKKVPDNQWTKRPADGGWSVAECFEHIVIAMPAQMGGVQNSLNKAANSSKDMTHLDGYLLSRMTNRGTAFPTPLPPRERDISKEDLLERFQELDKQFIAMINNRNAPYRNHYGPSPFGEADAYQLLLLTSGHVLRHTFQIREVLREINS